MPTNYKSRVRERMEKYGESWQTAARHVQNQNREPGRFEAIVLRIIDLTKKRNAEHDNDPRNQTEGRMLADIVATLFEPMPPCKAALTEALRALSMEDLRKLEVLMYSGRDGDDVFKTNRTLRRDDHDVTVITIRSKCPRLDRYLIAGLARARKDGVDLEADFDKAA